MAVELAAVAVELAAVTVGAGAGGSGHGARQRLQKQGCGSSSRACGSRSRACGSRSRACGSRAAVAVAESGRSRSVPLVAEGQWRAAAWRRREATEGVRAAAGSQDGEHGAIFFVEVGHWNRLQGLVATAVAGEELQWQMAAVSQQRGAAAPAGASGGRADRGGQICSTQQSQDQGGPGAETANHFIVARLGTGGTPTGSEGRSRRLAKNNRPHVSIT